MKAPTTPHVVVGVDASGSSIAAVRLATGYAHAANATLSLVHVYDVPDVPLGAHDDFPVHSAQVLARAAEVYLASLAPAAANIVVLRERQPARALLARAAGADLLVVGSRGRGGLTRLLLGSVSQACIHDAPCPVVVPFSSVDAGLRRPAASGLVTRP